MLEVSFRLIPVRSAEDLNATVMLFEAYAASIGVDLCFQGFTEELAAMPGSYAPPAGELLLVRDIHDQPSGCVALRPLAADGCCEMKRLYVSPHARGLGIGWALVGAVIGAAKRIGYREMRLDTLPTMADALSLYRKAGFKPINPYYDTTIAGTCFLGRSLIT